MSQSEFGNENKIDFVIPWVDGNDKEWQAQRNQYAGKSPEDTADYRFRDWGTLKYWFRGVEKYAPWVNNIYFITCGHYPEWLNLNHPKLKFVKHEDYIPKEYLPTFNSHTIELNLHRISELSEKFIYFNDDIFLINSVKKEDFFEGCFPKYVAGLDLNDSDNGLFSYILLNDMQLLLNEKKTYTIIKSNISKWFNRKYRLKTNIKTILLMPFHNVSVLANPHTTAPIVKSTIKKMWMENREILNATSSHKFRCKDDVNQYIFSWEHILNGQFYPRKEKLGKYYNIKNDSRALLKDIKKQKYKIICINDSSCELDFEKSKKDLIDAFESILPEKSKFEL